ncbi:hypothetical protein F2Q70_00029233 [Brassica cretica]|uniref:HTH merR-type domain-containing protein n=1 Tax=Brassica cretica TaxID=69181 RepID=A0A8S9FG11_BRACR|nr:hypothetical protein F2Q70_00029233 [Brassica cretica]
MEGFSLSEICLFLELEAVPGTDTGFAPYFSISSSISGNNLCPRAGQRSRSSSFGFFVGWNFFFGPKVWSFDDLFRRFLRSDILKRTSPAFIPFHKISFLAAYSFFREDPFPSSLVGGRTRPRRLAADPFSSPTSVWGEISEPDNEAVPMAPLRQRCSYFLDDGPRSEIQEESLINIRKKFVIPPSVVMRCPSEFERASDGGSDEIAIYEPYLEVGFRVGVPSIVAEVSSFFGFCPSQLTPLTWRTLVAIQVLGEFHGFVVGVHEILYSYYFAPLASKPGFYHLWSRDGTPLVEEPSRGIKGNYPFGDDWDKRYLFLKIPGSPPYPSFWRTVDVARPMSFIGEVVAKLLLGVPQRFRWVNFLMSKEALRHSPIIYDEYQKAKTRKRRPFYTPPPRLVRAASSVSGPSSVDVKPQTSQIPSEP